MLLGIMAQRPPGPNLHLVATMTMTTTMIEARDVVTETMTMTTIEARYATETMTMTMIEVRDIADVMVTDTADTSVTMTMMMIEVGDAVEEEDDGENKNQEIDDRVVLYLSYNDLLLF